MNCREIVKKYLEENGYDGLYCHGECGCLLDDLAPCDSDFTSCEPGYKHENAEYQGELVDWIISSNKARTYFME